MKQIDYNQIRLEDTGLYDDNKTSLHSMFYNSNVTTVGDVLNDNLMKKLFCRDFTPYMPNYELEGFIDLLKYKYLGLPLNNEDTLEIEIGSFSFLNILLYKLGFSQQQFKNIKDFWERLTYNRKKEISILDLLKEIVNDEDIKNTDPVLHNISKLNIESYNKSKNSSKDEYTTLILLREQLFKLIDVKDTLDKQINDLQQKIDELVKINTESGVSK